MGFDGAMLFILFSSVPPNFVSNGSADLLPKVRGTFLPYL